VDGNIINNREDTPLFIGALTIRAIAFSLTDWRGGSARYAWLGEIQKMGTNIPFSGAPESLSRTTNMQDDRVQFLHYEPTYVSFFLLLFSKTAPSVTHFRF
jgi:hypothetical protein